MRFKEIGSLFASAAAGWSSDNALRLSAALAYYSLFSLAPLLMILISLAGLIYGAAAARGEVAGQIAQLAGSRAADAIQQLVLTTSNKPAASFWATVVGLLVLLFGASSAFSELKDALNTIWGVSVKQGRPLWTMVRARFIAFAMVLSVGALLVVSLIISAVLAALGSMSARVLHFPTALWKGVDFLSSVVIVTVLFALLFKMLPNVRLRISDVWIGAVLTSLLFTIGKFLIGLYLGTSGVTSYYGAAGSAVVLLLWIYYSACILFYGAEFTKAYTVKFGSGIKPDRRAEFRTCVDEGTGTIEMRRRAAVAQRDS